MTDLFRDKAEGWDALPFPQQLSLGIGDCMLNNVDITEGTMAMDFGAGTGLITARVASKAAHVTAVDVSQAMLEKLSSKTELAGKVDVVCQDILEQPLDKHFDLIVSAMAMHHVKDTDQLLRRFAEHLKPGGRVALADLDEEDGSFHAANTEGVFHAGFNRDALGKTLEENGFEGVRFFDATTVTRESKRYAIFLVTATKRA